jgi:hypothetical protein
MYIIFYTGLSICLTLTSLYIIKNYNYKFDTKYIETCMTRYE